MTAPREHLDAKVRLWLTYVDEDLRTAASLADAEPPVFRTVAFHAQQAAEKAIKALLIWRGEDFPMTHNIRRLVELCQASGHVDFPEADALTRYCTTTRYPGIDRVVAANEAAEALRLARAVVTAVNLSLKRECFIM